MKTPEELAEEYMDQDEVACAAINHDAEDLVEAAFLAGYQAAKESNSPEKPDGCNSSNNSNGWISVKDRLPEEDVDVAIGWFSKTASNKTFWTVDAAQLTNKVFSGWRVYPEATHWMPLPKPPEK